MFKESKKRAIVKTVSWRILATLTTALLVYLFTGELGIAISVGLLEMIAKMVLYYLHERVWDKSHYGKQRIPGFVLWIAGIPCSGKTTLADMIYEQLESEKLNLQRLDSHDIRPLFPEIGFLKAEVNNHVKRVGHLASMLEKRGVIVIASFVSPYRESREFVKEQCNNYIEVFLDMTPKKAKEYDNKGLYEKAERGEIKHFPGVSVEYEAPDTADMVIDMNKNSLEQAKELIMENIQNRFLK